MPVTACRCGGFQRSALYQPLGSGKPARSGRPFSCSSFERAWVAWLRKAANPLRGMLSRHAAPQSEEVIDETC
jgi:hypothetical protein